MIIKVLNETPFQVLTGAFSIGPSETGYELQVGATPQDFATLFSVGANTTRMVTNVANGSYYRLKNNVGEVKVNWSRTCVTEGGGSGSGTELTPIDYFPLDAEEGIVVAYNGPASATGVYQYDGSDWVPVGVDDLSAYWTSAETKSYVDSASTVLQDQIDTMDEVVSEALVDLNERIDEMSGSTGGGDILTPSSGFSPDDEIGSVRSVNGTEGSWAYWVQTVSAANSSVTYTYHQNMPAGFTADIATINANMTNVTGGIQVNCFSGSNGDYFKIDYGYGDGATLLHYEANYSTPGSSGETQSYLVLNAWIVSIACKMNISWENTSDELILTISLIKYADGEPHPATGTFTPINNFTDNYLIDENTPGIPGGAKVLTADGAKTLATEDYVSAATAGKANAANVTARISANDESYLPAWNEQGVITGDSGQRIEAFQIGFNDYYIDAYRKYMGSGSMGMFYAPDAPGTAGDILVSTGSGAPVWSAMPAADVTKAYVDSAITAVEDHIYDVEKVTASALTELHDDILELSGSSVDLSGYYTSGETDAAISAATAGKANAANVEENRFRKFPTWNDQGIITGTTGNTLEEDRFYFNNKSFIFPHAARDEKPNRIYAPESAGTAGEILVSTGNGAPVWSAMTFPTPDVDKAYVDSAITEVQDQIDTMDDVVSAALVDLNDRKVESTSVSTIWKGTQAEYDLIVTKDASTLYIIVNNS